MKYIYAVLLPAFVLAIVFTTHLSFAQTDGFAVTQRGADWRVLSKTTVENGTNRVHQYTELAAGMNYTNSYGQWTEAKEQITLLPTGGAAATQGQHQVYFPPDIYNGVLEVVTPDGRHLKSHPLAISYDDGSNTVFIATLKHAQGYLTSSNQVTYPDAFTDFKADLVCTYRRGGFECDLVFRQQPPTPDQYGLDSSFSTLQLVTEFFNTVDPQEIPAQADDWFGLQDTTLKFGKLTMTHGKAFAVKSQNSSTLAPNVTSSVYKTWTHVAGRTFLIEEVPLAYIADDLDTLPEATNALSSKVTGSIRMASNRRQMPPAPEFMACTNQMLMASAEMNKQPGVVLDYSEVDSDQTDFTFQAGTTYFINGGINFDGTTTFEGGAVVKYAAGASIQLTAGPDYVSWQATNSDHPVIFTAVDDDSVGEIIPGSSGNPSGYYAAPALELYSTNSRRTQNFRNLRVFYAMNAFQDAGWASTLNVYDSQFVNCLYGATAYVYKTYFYNVLFDGCQSCFSWQTGGQAYLQNATVHGAAYIFDGYPKIIYLTNCILAGVQQINYGYNNNNNVANHTGFYLSKMTGTAAFTNTFYPFKSAGGAGFYLLTNSAFVNIGTTNIDTNLLAEIQTMTTCTPQDGSMPDTNAPDLGYHYPVNEDSDYDDLPDWWEWYWFGTYTNTGSTLDGNGNTLLTDYQNGMDPNAIQFSLGVANNYVSTSYPTLSANVSAGTPFYYAAVVDSTNLAGATWTAYTSSNLTANLGSLQGWHQVWVGLRGRPATATPTWQWKQLKLDTTPPVLVITSPTNSTVSVPLIQLTGYSPEALSGISYDLTNALGLVTNQQVLVTDQAYSTNTFEFTTNTFQAFDVLLTNGVNTFTLHATDLAGNVTTTNVSFTLDYSSKTNPPVMQIAWPQNGAQISGSNFTCRGWISDPSATVAVPLVFTNGDTNVFVGGVYTNVYPGTVGRNGDFWLENLPLKAGTNTLPITVTDVVGNTNVTNITVIQSSLVLTMNPVSPDSQLWQPTVNLTGNISDATSAVWVNGVKGHNNGDGTWSANNVPVNKGGTANFDITAYAPDEQQPDGSFGN